MVIFAKDGANGVVSKPTKRRTLDLMCLPVYRTCIQSDESEPEQATNVADVSPWFTPQVVDLKGGMPANSKTASSVHCPASFSRPPTPVPIAGVSLRLKFNTAPELRRLSLDSLSVSSNIAQRAVSSLPDVELLSEPYVAEDDNDYFTADSGFSPAAASEIDYPSVSSDIEALVLPSISSLRVSEHEESEADMEKKLSSGADAKSFASMSSNIVPLTLPSISTLAPTENSPTDDERNDRDTDSLTMSNVYTIEKAKSSQTQPLTPTPEKMAAGSTFPPLSYFSDPSVQPVDTSPENVALFSESAYSGTVVLQQSEAEDSLESVPSPGTITIESAVPQRRLKNRVKAFFRRFRLRRRA